MLREVRFENGKVIIRIAENKDLVIELTEKQINEFADLVDSIYGLK